MPGRWKDLSVAVGFERAARGRRKIGMGGLGVVRQGWRPLPLPDSRPPLPASRLTLPDSRQPVPDSRSPLPVSPSPQLNPRSPLPVAHLPQLDSPLPLPCPPLPVRHYTCHSVTHPHHCLTHPHHSPMPTVAWPTTLCLVPTTACLYSLSTAVHLHDKFRLQEVGRVAYLLKNYQYVITLATPPPHLLPMLDTYPQKCTAIL